MTSFEALDKEQKVNATLQHDVQSMCTEACHFLGLNITKSAMELLLDVFFHKMTCYADDLERFAKHAKRSVISSDDCKLLTRRNHALGHTRKMFYTGLGRTAKTSHLNSLKLPTSATKRRRTTTTSAVSSPKRARAAVNREPAVENTSRAVENTSRAVDNVHATEESIERDADAIDLTFD